MNWSVFVIFLAACAGAASTGFVFKPGRWYRSLSRPEWTPPDWVFPVAWSILYVVIAFAASRVSARPENAMAMGFWSLQIVLNTLWTPIFFGAHRIRAGAMVIGLLWLAIAATLVSFWRLDILAGLLTLPYLAWVTLALALNISIWRRNRSIAAAA